MKKKIIYIILIILCILTVIGIFYRFKMKDENTINKIKYDMKITYNHVIEMTGYGTEYDFDLIDIKNKKVHFIHDYNIWGNESNPLKKGHNYTIKTIKLTDNDIKMLLQLTNKESEEYLKNDYNKEYLTIEYKGKTIYLENSKIHYDNKK